MLGHTTPLYKSEWPKAEAALAKADEITLIVQVDGKLRARVTLPADVTEEQALAAAHAAEDAKPWLQGKTIAKQVYVPGRLVNIATTA
jgi:leucyl-tRNA synthetase